MKKSGRSRKKRTLFVQHLERVSPGLLERYPEVIRRVIRGRHGVYALYRRDSLYYVGLASNLMGRLKNHLADRHKKAWDRFSVYLTLQSDHMKELESFLIRILQPKGNKTGGRFATSQDLKRSVYRQVADYDADQRAALLGGAAAQRRVRNRTRRERGGAALVNAFGASKPLRATSKGRTFGATLRTNGTIRYAGRIYPSPTAAASAAVGRICNGWTFWRYRNDRKQWVPLSRLKR